MNEISLAVWHTGEYEDATEQIIFASISGKICQEVVDTWNELLKQYGYHMNRNYNLTSHECFNKPDFFPGHIDYTGARVELETLSLSNNTESVEYLTKIKGYKNVGNI